jgi:hypothetical protein
MSIRPLLGDELELFGVATVVDDAGILASWWGRDAVGLEVEGWCVGTEEQRWFVDAAWRRFGGLWILGDES